MKGLRALACTVAFGLVLPAAASADTADLVREQCAGCHALQAPDYAKLGIDERIERKGPPLYYAGNKFRPEWLREWLQKPVRIRPSGVFPPAHARGTPDGDIVDESSLPAHVALPADQAAAVTEYLMGLKPFDERLAAVSYEPGSIAARLGQMNFRKFKGCDACHRDAPDAGGVSGPELYTAWRRLQPAFIAAFIANPVEWDPHALMPRAALADAEVKKLVDYLKTLSEQQP